MTFEEYIATLDWEPTVPQLDFIRAFDEAAQDHHELFFVGSRLSGKTELLKRLEEYWNARMVARGLC